MSFAMQLRKALLIKRDSRWNAIVRDFTAQLEWFEHPLLWLRERREVQARKVHPHIEGDFLIIGPHCFRLLDDDTVINYAGANYHRDPDD